MREDPSFGSFSDKISPLRLFRALSMANLLNNLIMTRILAAITLLLSIVLTILVTIFCSVPIILAGVVKRARERGEIDPAIRTSQILDQYYMHCYRQIHLWYFNGMTTKLVDRIPVFFDILWKTLSPPAPGG